MEQGLCKGNHTPWFSHDEEEQQEAKSVCMRCPVQMECLDYAIDSGIWEGIYGGLTGAERTRHAKKLGKVRHGSITGYTTDRCRCDLCRREIAEYDKDKRPRRTSRTWGIAAS